jgi:hypothetical protein
VLRSFFNSESSRENFIRSIGWFALGAFLTGSSCLPTFLKFGLQAGLGGTGTAAVMNIGNVAKVLNPLREYSAGSYRSQVLSCPGSSATTLPDDGNL